MEIFCHPTESTASSHRIVKKKKKKKKVLVLLSHSAVPVICIRHWSKSLIAVLSEALSPSFSGRYVSPPRVSSDWRTPAAHFHLNDIIPLSLVTWTTVSRRPHKVRLSDFQIRAMAVPGVKTWRIYSHVFVFGESSVASSEQRQSFTWDAELNQTDAIEMELIKTLAPQRRSPTRSNSCEFIWTV